jgi:phosphoglycolate phosphatase-like HAD superfamily hydrolase
MSTGISLSNYETVIFDCDGVLLNSNKIKTDAFYQVALPYGAKAANSLVRYHTSNGGVSRYRKFSFFIKSILKEDQCDNGSALLSRLLSEYASIVFNGLMECEIAGGLGDLRGLSPAAKWMVISGGDERELRKIFLQRNLARLFDGGIFGSPSSKEDIIERETASGNIQGPTVFIGDSRYDYKCARNAGFDFIFASGWSEIRDWGRFVSEEAIVGIRSLSDLLVK